MALDRWIALILLGVCLAYGYTAWFTMDAGLAPFMKRNPIWPSTFPKVLSVGRAEVADHAAHRPHRHIRGLVFGPRGAWHLHAALARFLRGLTC